MVSKQFTALSLLMPVAMAMGTLISIYVYKNSQQNLAIVPIVGSVVLIALLYNLNEKTKKKL